MWEDSEQRGIMRCDATSFEELPSGFHTLDVGLREVLRLELAFPRCYERIGKPGTPLSSYVTLLLPGGARTRDKEIES